MENSYLNFIGYESQDFFPKIEMGIEEEYQSFELIREERPSGFPFENESNQQLFSNPKSNNLIHNIFDAAFNPQSSAAVFAKPKKHLPFKISNFFEN